MDVINIATRALIDALERNHIPKEKLIEGTNVSFNYLKHAQSRHSWSDFVKMFQNVVHSLGPHKAAIEIAYTGIHNEDVSTMKKIAAGFVNVKMLYWFQSYFVAKFFYKNIVTYQYKSLGTNKIQIKLEIDPAYEECPYFFETHHCMFENGPTILGLKKAHVESSLTSREGVFSITLPQKGLWLNYLFSFFKSREGHRNSVILMRQLEIKKQELENSIEEKSHLLRILSHDISNSACIIDLSLNMLEKNIRDNPVAATNLKRAQLASRNLIEVLTNIKMLEKSEKMTAQDLKPVDLDLEVEALFEINKSLAEQKNISLEFSNQLPKYALPLAEKDSLRINVLGNLLSNAIKFSFNNSKVLIEASLKNDLVEIRVIDEGAGMSDKERENLFFKKIHKSTIGTNGEHGTGFGMGIVKSFVEMYGGTIGAYKHYPQGTMICLNLPCHMTKPIGTAVSESLEFR